MLAVVNWTTVLDTFIATIPLIITSFGALIYSKRVHTDIQLPSKKPLGEAMEYTHDTAIANNMLLSRNNSTKTASDHKVLEDHAVLPPQIPADD